MHLYLGTANNLNKLPMQNLHLPAFNSHSSSGCSRRLQDLIIYISLNRGVIEVVCCRPGRCFFFPVFLDYFVSLKSSFVFIEKKTVNVLNVWRKGCITRSLNHGIIWSERPWKPWGLCHDGDMVSLGSLQPRWALLQLKIEEH